MTGCLQQQNARPTLDTLKKALYDEVQLCGISQLLEFTFEA